MTRVIFLVFLISIQISFDNVFAQQLVVQNYLPKVFGERNDDILAKRMFNLANEKASAVLLSHKTESWGQQKAVLRKKIVEQTGAILQQRLLLDIRVTKVLKKQGFIVKNIYFQTRPGIYATANLYIPDGKGPFPAVIVMSGHSKTGKSYKNYNEVGQTLALNGYVSLNIDPWGAGERSTQQGEFEYHGAKLGASLMDVGESLMGMQLTDNIRGVDLLCSLPFVDASKIGATGASGGGNQTMWLAALDERVKAAVPVVSVGTFESYIMRHNCVCEVLPNGLTFTEEDAVIALVAPRAIKICNANFDSNPTFFPSEMLKTFQRAQPLFKSLGVEDNISYQNFDLKHGYFPEEAEAMIGWFNLHLKNVGNGEPVKGTALTTIPEEELLVFSSTPRDAKVMSTLAFCREKSEQLKSELLETEINVSEKRKELRNLIGESKKEGFKKVHPYGNEKDWDKIGLETCEGEIIPVLHRKPTNRSSAYVIVLDAKGKSAVSNSIIDDLVKKGSGIIMADLWGTGENSSPIADKFDLSLVPFHTLSRTALWLGKTTMGKWVTELDVIVSYLKKEKSANKIEIIASKEAGLAALLASALNKEITALSLNDTPLSYQLLDKVNINFYSMALHLPNILVWGDISLMVALSNADITFTKPLTLSGIKIEPADMLAYRKEFHQLKDKGVKKGLINFIN